MIIILLFKTSLNIKEFFQQNFVDKNFQKYQNENDNINCK